MSFCQGDHQLSWWGSSECVGVNATKWQGYEYGGCGEVWESFCRSGLSVE